MANGLPSKRYSEQSKQTWRNIMAMKQQGATDDEVEEYLTSIGAERVNDRGMAENLGRGFLQGMGEGVTSTIGVAGMLTRPIGGRALGDWAARQEAENARFYDPLGTSGAIGRGAGRILQEGAQAVLAAGPAAKLVSKIPGVGTSATRALRSGSRLERAAATAALSAPVDIAQGLKSDTPILLPESTGRLGSVLESVGISGAAGALFPARPGGGRGRRGYEAPPTDIRRPQKPGQTVIDERLVRVPQEPGAAGPVGAVIPDAQAVLPAGQRALPGGRRALPAGVVPEVPATPAARPTPDGSAPKPMRGWAISDIRSAKTGQPFTSRMLRGEGGAVAQGTGDMAILGPARYTTPDWRYASFFAEDAEGGLVGGVRELDVRLERPLVIDNDNQWNELTKRAGWRYPNPTGLPPEEIRQYTGALRSVIEGDGYDGVIVRIPRDYIGKGPAMRLGDVDERYGKTLDNVFGGDQVIEFKAGREAEAQPVEVSRAAGMEATPQLTSAQRAVMDVLENGGFASETGGYVKLYDKSGNHVRDLRFDFFDRLRNKVPGIIGDHGYRSGTNVGGSATYTTVYQLSQPQPSAATAATSTPTEAVRPAVSAEADLERQMIADVEGDGFRRYMEMPIEELKAAVPRGPLSAARLGRMAQDQLDAVQAYYLRLRDEAMDRAGPLGQEHYQAEFTEHEGFLTAKYARGEGKGIGYKGAKSFYGNAEQARKIKNLSEEQLGWLEERGISPEDYPKMRDAADRLVDIDKILTRIDDAVRERESFDFGPRAGFAAQQVVGTLGGGVVGGTAGAATGDTPEERRRRALAGFAIGAGAGAGAMALARRGGRVPSGSTESIRNYNTSIRIGEQAAPERWLTPAQRAYTSIVSETYPMVAAGRAAAGEAGGQAVLEEVARSQGAGGAARQYIDDNVRPVLQAASDKWDDIRALLKARRDLNIREVGGGYRVTDPSGRVIAEGITPAQLREMGALPEGYTATPVRGAPKSDFTDDQVRQTIVDAEGDPAVKAAADRINGIYRDLLRLKYEAGILTEDEYRRILQSEDFYDPFVREFGAERAVAGAGGKKFSISSKGISQMDRMAEAAAETADPLEVLVSSINRTMNVVGRQRVANVLFELADIGELPFIRVVDGPVTPESRRFRQLRNGVPVTYEVTDPDIYEAMAGIAQSPGGGNALVNFARQVKEAKQFGITQNPFFALFNLGRDIAASGIQRPDIGRAVREGVAGAAIGGAAGGLTAEDGERLRGVLRGVTFGAGAGMYARPFAEVMGAVRNIYRNDEIFKEFLRQGGSTEGFFVRSPSDARKVLQGLERSGVSLSDIITPKRWVDVMQAVGSAAEQSTRLATYKQMIANGATREAAVLAAQDRTLRFANVGKDTKGIAKVTAFWNAGVQGWDKLFRMLKDPRTSTMAAAMLTAPSLALWSVNKDNPEYWQRPLWERNLFWLVPKPDGSGFYRYPKPFEIGYIFASLPERLLDFAAQSGGEIPGLSDLTSASPEMAEPGRQLRRATGEMVSSVVGGKLPVPDIFSLPAQLVSNYDLFRGRRIVTQPNVPAPQQVTPESSALARVLADQFGISPQKTDFAIRAQFGTLGQFASERLDAAIRAAGGEASEPRAKGQGVLPRRFVTQQYSQTETESQARDILAGLDRTYAGYRVEQKTRDPDRMAEYFRENKSDIRAYNLLGDQRRALDDIASERRAVTRNVAITPERKEELLSDLRKRGETVSKSVLKYRIAP